jgi:D-alanyl-D-alanine carboxypeptidase
MNTQQYLESKFKELNLVGLACAISFDNKITGYNYGMASRELHQPVVDDSIFNIASVGKLFTVISVLKLIELQKLRLNSQVGEVLKDVPSAWKNIRVEHLLSHSSGIRNYTDMPDYWLECKEDVSRERILEYVANEPLQFEPGTLWKYSNTGFYLLGLIIEQITGYDYFEFVEQIITGSNPDLKIVRTDHNDLIKERVTGYQQIDGVIERAPYYSSSGTFSAGGFSASLKDFIRFENGLFNGEVLDISSMKILLESFRKEDGKTLRSPDPDFEFEMGYGLFKFKRNGKTQFAHRGEIYGFCTEYMRVLEDNFSVIISTNLESGSGLNQMVNEVYDVVVSSFRQ